MFKRKVYDKLKEWKDTYNGKYACLLEGARRVGKTTIAEEFAENEYQTYIKIDFSNITDELLDVFKDINKLDLFFLRLQTETGIDLFKRKSVIIFDEIQLYPKARQAIKHLVADGRYDYIETGSLISIKKNVKDILIPSEEYKIQVYPMDYEEFLWATNGNPGIYKKILESKMSLGDSTNRTLMREFRIYMAVGGMPQAVETYIETNNLSAVDKVKRRIIDLYSDDLKKIDSSGRLGNIYLSIPSKDEERFFDLVDSKIVLPCYNVTQPDIALELTKDFDYFKLYFSDIGLFTTMLFDSGKGIEDNIYSKLLSDKLEYDLGYLYENVVAQMIVASGRNLYYHTWRDKDKTHSNEVDFLITNKNKIIPIEVKSSNIKNHKSIDLFVEKYTQIVGRRFLFSQKDISHDGMLELMPIYLVPFILESL